MNDQEPPRKLNYAQPEPSPATRSYILWGGILAAGGLVLAALMLADVAPPPAVSRQITCDNHLKMIGQSILQYANDHGSEFPDSFQTLLASSYKGTFFDSAIFVCPATSDTMATGPTTQAAAANLIVGGHLSYIYTAKGFSTTAPANAVLAYEPLSNHGNGMNVLYGDGHVDFISVAQAQKILAELNAGHNPPRAEQLK